MPFCPDCEGVQMVKSDDGFGSVWICPECGREG